MIKKLLITFFGLLLIGCLLLLVYLYGPWWFKKVPATGSSNGRVFKKMYGASAEEVKQHLVTVDWFGGQVKFTKINGAAEQLKKVAAELAQHPELASYLPSAGTFYWRQVRGAQRQR